MNRKIGDWIDCDAFGYVQIVDIYISITNGGKVYRVRDPESEQTYLAEESDLSNG